MSLLKTLQVAPELNPEVVLGFIIEHLRNANILKIGGTFGNAPDCDFKTNEEFWNIFLNEETTNFHWVTFNSFQVVDWYPRSPGLFHTKDAAFHRQKAAQFIGGQKDGAVFYEPYGKANFIQGGLGAIRFKPLIIEGQECRLCTATSDGYCHSGIPLVIPQRLLDKTRVTWTNLYKIKGQIRFLPDFIEPYFSHMARVPQVYVLVDSIGISGVHSSPVYITPIVYFTTQQNKENNATFYTCRAGDYAELDRAAKWLEWYVQKYKGEIVTNFDQQRPTFENAPFSLQHVLQGDLQIELADRLFNGEFGDELLLAIQKVNSLTLVDKRIINEGDTFNFNGPIRGSILNINSTLKNVNQVINSSPITDTNFKEELSKLVDQLMIELQNVPPDKVEQAGAVAEYAKLLVVESTGGKPHKPNVRINAKELSEVAEKIATVMPMVLTITSGIVRTVSQLVGIPIP